LISHKKYQAKAKTTSAFFSSVSPSYPTVPPVLPGAVANGYRHLLRLATTSRWLATIPNHHP